MAIIGYIVVGYFALKVVCSVIGVGIIAGAIATMDPEERK